MRHLLLTLLAVFAVSTVFGQDLIIKHNAEEIEAKVEEITDTYVKYRKSENPDGPIYNISKSEVLMIKYENGSKDVFADESPSKTETVLVKSTLATTSTAELTRLRSNGFALGGSPVFSFQEANKFIADPDIVHRLKKGVTMKWAAIGLGVGGAVLTLIGAGISASAIPAWDGDFDRLHRAYRSRRYGTGSAIGSIGSAAVITAIVLGSVSPGIVKRAIREYNYNARTGRYSGSELGFAVTPGGLGMQLTF